MNTPLSEHVDDHLLEKQRPSGIVFLLFIFWTFVLVCRPQDLFPFLAAFRPALLCTALALGSAVFSGVLFRGPSIFAERQGKLYMALFLVMILSVPFSLYVGLSFKFLFTAYIVIVAHFFLFLKLVDSIQKLAVLLFVTCLGSGIYAAISVKTGNIVDGRLFFGDMFDPNDLAFFALSFLPLNLLFITGENPLWKRAAGLLCFAVSLLMILLTGSRGGLLAVGLVGLLLLFRKTQTITVSMKFVAVGLVLAILSVSTLNVERYATMLNLKEDYNVHGEEGRLFLWSIGMRAMLKKPLTGVGVMCFPNAVGLERETGTGESQAWETAHNSIIQIGTETGLVGLILFLLISLNVLRIFNKARKEAASDLLVKISEMGFAGFVGLFASGMFLSQAYSIYWAMYVAISAVASRLLSRQQALLNQKKA